MRGQDQQGSRPGFAAHVCLFAVGLLASGCSEDFWDVDARPGVRVAVSRTHYDFGKIAIGQQPRCEFELRNVGSQPLRIAGTKTSCGCLAHLVSRKELMAGEAALIVVELNTLGLRAPSNLSKDVWVELVQGTAREQRRLSIAAQLCPDIAVEPDLVSFRESERGGWLRCDVMIRREMLSPGEFADVRMVGSGSYYAIEERNRSRDELHFEASLRRSEAPTYPESLQVRYRRSGEWHVSYVPVAKLRNKDGVELVPACCVVTARRDMEGEGLYQDTRRAVRLVSRQGKEVEISDVRLKDAESASPFAWKLAVGKKDQFELWAERIPSAERVTSAELVISYWSRGDEHRGELTLKAYLISGASREARISSNHSERARRAFGVERDAT